MALVRTQRREEEYADLSEIASYEKIQKETRLLINKMHHPFFNYFGMKFLSLFTRFLLIDLIPLQDNPLHSAIKKLSEKATDGSHFCDNLSKHNGNQLIEFAGLTRKDFRGLTEKQITELITDKITRKCITSGKSALIFRSELLVLISFVTGVRLSYFIQNKFLQRYPLGYFGVVSTYFRDKQALLKPHPTQLIPNQLLQRNKAPLQLLHKEMESQHFYFRNISRLVICLILLMRALEISINPTLMTAFVYTLLPTALSSVPKDTYAFARNIYAPCRKQHEEQQRLKTLKQTKLKFDRIAIALQQPEWMLDGSVKVPKLILDIRESKTTSKKGIYLALQFVFIKHDIALLAWNNHQFIIDANSNLDDKKLKKIIDDCNLYILRRNQKNKLEEQLIKLQRIGLLQSYLVEPIEDKEKNIDYQFNLYLKDGLSSANVKLIQNLLNVNKLEENARVFSRQGTELLSDSNFNQLKEINTATLATIMTEAKEASAKKLKKKATPIAETPSAESKTVESKPVVINFGRYGIYDSSNPTCPIKEIRCFYYPRHSHFGIFTAATGDKKRDEQFSNILKREQLDAPKGHAGIVKSMIKIRDKNGRWHFRKTLKLKDPGLDGRVIPNNEVRLGPRVVLHDFDTYVPKHSR